ncbi:hypothetical protein M514_04213, partial [Trichuris suis]
MYKFVSRSTPRISDQRKFIDAHSFRSCVNVEQPCSVLRVAVSDSRSLANSIANPESNRCNIRIAGNPPFSATLPKKASSVKFCSSSETSSSVASDANSDVSGNSPPVSTVSSEATNGKTECTSVHLQLDLSNGKQNTENHVSSITLPNKAIHELTKTEHQLSDRIFLALLVLFVLWVSIFFPVMLFVSNTC